MPLDLPSHIVDTLADTCSERFNDHKVYKRAMRMSDDARAISVVIDGWQHDFQDSPQIGLVEPGWGFYSVRVQNMVKHQREEEGREIYNAQTALMRRVLYRDSDLRLRLLGTEQDVQGSAERIKRLNVRRQNFMNSLINGTFVYLCTSELTVDVEITKL